MNNPGKIRYKKKSNKFAGTVMFLLIFLLSVSTIITIQLRSERRKNQIKETAASTSSQKVIENDIPVEKIDIEEDFSDIPKVQTEENMAEKISDKIAEEEPAVFTAPVNGDIIKQYSTDNLIYSGTMGDWRQHLGTDIKCDYESEISSMCEGVVTDIYDDIEFGRTVMIEHPDGVVIRYSCINVNGNITIGKEVKSGEIIGSVITNPVCEFEDDLHIHIEASKGSVRIDPMTLIK